MALEIIGGATYRSAATTVQKPEYKGNEVSIQETGTSNISVSDVPAIQKPFGDNHGDDNMQKEQDKAASEKQIMNAVSRANSKIKNHRTKFEFSYHEETRRVSIKVMDKETDEVIKEIPPEETLEMIEKMWELAGILVDERR